MMITSLRRLSRSTVVAFPPSRVAVTAALYASIAALKPGISTGGLGYAGLFDMPSCTLFKRCSRSPSDIPVTPNTGLMMFNFVFAIRLLTSFGYGHGSSRNFQAAPGFRDTTSRVNKIGGHYID